MQSCVYKIYRSKLSKRENNHVEDQELLSSSRMDCSCLDHVSCLCELVRLNAARTDCKVYALFNDFRRAFPSVDRNLLLRRLLDTGIEGKKSNRGKLQ